MTATATAAPITSPSRLAWDREVSAYLTHLRVGRVSPNTLRSYGASLAAWARFLEDTGRPVDPRDATRRDVEAFMAHLAVASSPSTQKTRFVALATFFKWLASEEEGVITRSPFAGVRTPRVPDVEVPVLGPEEVERLLATCSGQSFDDRRDRAIILLMLSTGARRGEVADLLREDLLEASARVIFHGKGERFREATYGDATSTAIRHYLRARDREAGRIVPVTVGRHDDTARTGEPLFLVSGGTGHRGALGPNGLSHMLERRARQARLGRIHPHQLRHTWADGMLAGGASEGDTMRLGGWKTRTMLDRYGRANAHQRALAAYRDPVDRMVARRGTGR